MNSFIKDEISEAVISLGYSLGELTPLESRFFREKMALKFLNGIDAFPIWERICLPSMSIRNSAAFEWLDEFIQYQEVNLFFHKEESQIVYTIHSGTSVSSLLNELPRYEFHFTNESLEYLLCFSDADYLIACGTAEPWLRNKAIELSKTGWRDADGFYWDENGVKKR